MVESYSKNGNTESLRRSVFALLDKDPYLTAKTICEMLGLPYKEKYRYLNKLKNNWKSNHENKQGSNCSSAHGNAQVVLTWSPPATDGGAAITGYKIYKATSTGQESPTTSLGNVLTYTDPSVTNGQTYYYYITATNAKGESTASSEVSATPTAPIIKSMAVDVKTDKTSYSRGQTVTITVTAGDSGNGGALKGVTAKVTINDPNNRALWTGSSTTNSNGLSTLTYRLSNTATKGTYTTTATATYSGYSTGNDQTTFTIK
jgi:uncharacterized protein YfaS (alpha-2-macroglobulin family)